jgi:hypothetical protein
MAAKAPLLFPVIVWHLVWNANENVGRTVAPLPIHITSNHFDAETGEEGEATD